MSKTARPISLSLNSVSKRYNIELQKRTHTFRGDLPYLFSKTKLNYKWALKNITFQIYKGEVFGIIGPNGAGKSTLLKIISRITPPTEGNVEIHGKTISILDIGTGFHPELTGEENVLLNGAILGISPHDIKPRLTQIIDFAGQEVKKYIHVPLKRYSSGMAVRLAFSIAVHLSSDILIFDEILTVGDEEFTQKSHQKIKEIIKSGRTILMVSHNLKQIEAYCHRVMVLQQGELQSILPAKEAVKFYRKSLKEKH